MKKKMLSLLLIVAIFFTLIPTVSAASEDAISAANALYELGLFKGTGTNADGTPNFDLDRTPTRNEAVTMLVRLLGKEEEAQNSVWDVPFEDLDAWVTPYVGYAYANGLTTGTSATTFGGNETVTASQYITFVLRALGYESGTDFQWDKAWELSDNLGVTNGNYNADTITFTRGDVAAISYNALSITKKNSTVTIADELDLNMDEKSFDTDSALVIPDGSEPSIDEADEMQSTGEQLEGVWQQKFDNSGVKEYTFSGNEYIYALKSSGGNSVCASKGTFVIENGTIVCTPTTAEGIYTFSKGEAYYDQEHNGKTLAYDVLLSQYSRISSGGITNEVLAYFDNLNGAELDNYYTVELYSYNNVKTLTAITGVECAYSREKQFDISNKLSGFHHNCACYEYIMSDSQTAVDIKSEYCDYLESIGYSLYNVSSLTMVTDATSYDVFYKNSVGKRISVSILISKYSGITLSVTLYDL